LRSGLVSSAAGGTSPYPTLSSGLGPVRLVSSLADGSSTPTGAPTSPRSASPSPQHDHGVRRLDPLQLVLLRSRLRPLHRL
jgi:hypothetical protein